MAISMIHVSRYRSIRSIRFPVDPLTVFVGRNGVGKTNLYRSLQLLQAAGAGTLSREIAAEGGMGAVSWAGVQRRHEPARIALGVSLTAGDVPGLFDYAIELGFPEPTAAAFSLEPQVKTERVSYAQGRRPAVLLDRRGPSVSLLDDRGKARQVDTAVLSSETAFARIGDAGSAPEIDALRRTVLDWRFYHDLRTDAASPLRRPALAVTTPTLASDGSDLAAVFATLKYIREDSVDLDAAITDAFPGARLVIAPPDRTATFGMVFPDYPKREFEAGELSDGTLRFLALAGALLGYRLPTFLALNEPEGSLHPDLLPALGRMIAQAAKRTQVWVVTHSNALAAAIMRHGDVLPREVVKHEGATWIEDLTQAGFFREGEA